METDKKKLYRKETEKVIGGVCGGLATYFDVDVVLIRGIFLLLALMNGVGILLYIILMVLMPKEPVSASTTQADAPAEQGVPSSAAPQTSNAMKNSIEDVVSDLKQGVEHAAEEIRTNFSYQSKRNQHDNRKNVLGIIIVIGGLLFLLNNIFPERFLRWDLIWPSIIILIGLFILTRSKQSHE